MRSEISKNERVHRRGPASNDIVYLLLTIVRNQTFYVIIVRRTKVRYTDNIFFLDKSRKSPSITIHTNNNCALVIGAHILD